jgi:hypothetical protein
MDGEVVNRSLPADYLLDSEGTSKQFDAEWFVTFCLFERFVSRDCVVRYSSFPIVLASLLTLPFSIASRVKLQSLLAH